MYLLKREIKSNMKSLALWIVIVVGIMSFSLSMFPSFAEQGDYISELMDSFQRK